MSDDLISRKALLEILNMRLSDYSHDSNCGAQRMADVYKHELIPVVEKAPTVFDKERVIDQLKEASYWESADIYDDDGYKDDYYDSEVIDLDKAIEIVERGGVE